jgi:hypothetical protein
MAHAAAATRTLRSPRRRPHGPAAPERAALLLVPLLASLRTCTARRTDVAHWRRTVPVVAGAIGDARGDDDDTFSEEGS